MDRGGVAFAVLGLVLTIVGVALDPWLDFSGHETIPRFGLKSNQIVTNYYS